MDPTAGDAAQAALASDLAEDRRATLRAKGRNGTVLTSALGDASAPVVQSKTLLGQ